MFKYSILLLVIALVSVAPMTVWSQNDIEELKKENLIEKKIENIAEGTDDETDFTNLIDDLVEIAKNPINLNSASREDLEQLNLLDEVQINNLLAHIAKNGKLMNLYELQSIDGWDLNTIINLRPYIEVKDNTDVARLSFKNIFKNGKSQFFTRYQQILEKSEGYQPASDSLLQASPNSRYAGSPYRLYTRYVFKYSTNLQFGITAEKDAGEQFFKGNQAQGFDFYSGHFILKNATSWLKTLAIGDYQAQFGQGLTAWTGLAFGKTADPYSIKRNAIGIRPYTSVDENRFLRGGAATFRLWKFELTGFYSYKKIDGNLTAADSTNDADVQVTSFDQSGYHRTVSEMDNRKTIQERMAGGHLSFKYKTLNLGFTGVNYKYSREIQANDDLYNQFELAKQSNSNYGIDYSYTFRNLNLFGETSMSQNGGLGSINGLFWMLDPKLTLIAVRRDFQPKFQSRYSNAITENTLAANESGTYVGFRAYLGKGWGLQGYADYFTFPWLKYQIDAPSRGWDYLLQVNYTPSKSFDAYFRIRQRQKQRNQTEVEEGIPGLVNLDQTNFRFNISYRVSPSIKLRNRIEYVLLKNTSGQWEKGFMMYQDVSYSAVGSPITISARYALFDTDSYNSRIYAYENDVLYAFSIPGLYYRGSRYYVTLKYHVWRGIDLWLRFSQTVYSNQTEQGSGISYISGSTRSEIKAQVRFSF
ncbi:MAG: helix-hairpin-helix domain-containing protein [Bacteroidia bacterium]|nr:helix-hairpin-helix domain-containing protein [Bacteroidia bacterium]